MDLLKKNEFTRASDYMQNALAGASDEPTICYHLGMVLCKTGKTAEALEKLEKALAGSDEFPGRPEAESALHEIKDMQVQGSGVQG